MLILMIVIFREKKVTHNLKSLRITTYSSQSTAIMIVTSSAGRPTVSSTMTIVINPACGIPAAPMEAAVAVTLIDKNRVYRKSLLET